MRSDEEAGMECEKKILLYQKMLGEHDVERDTRRMSEKEMEGLEPKQRHLIRVTGQQQNKIVRICNDIERKLKLIPSRQDLERVLGGPRIADQEVCEASRLIGVDPKYLSVARRYMSGEERASLRKELDGVVEELERLGSMKQSTMDPANFDLLERNELMIGELKEKIEKLEKDRLAIAQSISKLDDLGLRENLKAFTHINGRVGRLLRYFIPESDARIDESGGEYVLRVKIGNWKESLDELSGGQRSLVALCLIFSMLSYRPSSFYIFDEIDSALDLSYTQGIGEIIRSEFGNAQFIVVSLKSGMFDNANCIFKVYLQDGKSRVCRIK